MRCYHNSIQKSIILFTDRLFEQKWSVRMKEEKIWNIRSNGEAIDLFEWLNVRAAGD
jgi:hypothetical protein